MSTTKSREAISEFELAVTQEVKAWMGRRGVSARQLAAAIGLSNSPMSKRLRGDTAFTINDLGLIASYFGITLEQLLGEVARKRLIGVGDAESPTSEEVGLRVRTAAAGAGSSAVRPVGLEPTTQGLKVPCSTN